MEEKPLTPQPNNNQNMWHSKTPQPHKEEI